jgi:catechol 2,3-dioxygenase
MLAMPSIDAKLTHLGVYTDHPEAMCDFYRAVLGLVVSDTGMGHKFPRRIIFMTGNPAEHHQFVLVVREPGDPQGGALFQVSFKVQSLDHLRAVTARAVARKATGLRKMNHGNAWSVYFDDPDKNAVEIYMDTGWYVPQPFADDLLLDLPDAELRRRTDERVSAVAGTMPQAEWSARIAIQIQQARQGADNR